MHRNYTYVHEDGCRLERMPEAGAVVKSAD